MRILVDSSIWSVSLKPGRSHPQGDRLKHQIVTGRQAFLLGIVLQEVLQGIRDPNVTESIYAELSAFECFVPTLEDHREAAELYKQARVRGVSAGTVDCLIATMAITHDCRLHTLDRDFERIAEFSDLELF